MSRRTLDAFDLSLILRSLDESRLAALASVTWNQTDDDRDAERAEIEEVYAATTAKVCTLLEGMPTAAA